MKAIEAVARKPQLAALEIRAALGKVSLVVIPLVLSGLLDRLNRVVPRWVPRGRWLASSLWLRIQGMRMVAGTDRWLASDGSRTGPLRALAVVLLLVAGRIPAALILSGLGSAVAIGTRCELLALVGMGALLPSWMPPACGRPVRHFPQAALPQIRRMTLNSIIAVGALSAAWFPERRAATNNPAAFVLGPALARRLAWGLGARDSRDKP